MSENSKEVCLTCTASLACIAGVAHMSVDCGRSFVWFRFGDGEVYLIVRGPVPGCPKMKEIWDSVDAENDDSYY